MIDATFTSPTIPPHQSVVKRLTIVYSPTSQTGESRLFDAKPFMLGRQAGEGVVVVLDSQVSRQHCVLEPQSDEIRIRDLGSHNRTYRNGHAIDEAILENGDVIRVGETVLLYEYLSMDPSIRLASENSFLRGSSVALSQVRGLVADVAEHSLPVLILGETGSGKECVARAIHDQSSRTGSFVPVNCGALPEDLFESELFGHVAGAFTGAAKSKEGLFVTANHGTLFLDEIGDMPAPLQVKLLRVLSDGEIRPVGATGSTRVDVRVIAATNADVTKAIEAGKFRADLYARLNGWRIEVPPLRGRRTDILELAYHFLRTRDIRRDTLFTASAAEAMVLYPWPHNVRELEQSMGALAIRVRDRKQIDLRDLAPEIRTVLDHRVGKGTAAVPLGLRINPTAQPNADDLRAALTHFQGNVAHVAAFFGRDRRQIYRWAESYAIDVDGFREPRSDD